MELDEERHDSQARGRKLATVDVLKIKIVVFEESDFFVAETTVEPYVGGLISIAPQRSRSKSRAISYALTEAALVLEDREK